MKKRKKENYICLVSQHTQQILILKIMTTKQNRANGEQLHKQISFKYQSVSYFMLREPNIILKKPANVMFGAFDYNLFQLAITQIT